MDLVFRLSANISLMWDGIYQSASYRNDQCSLCNKIAIIFDGGWKRLNLDRYGAEVSLCQLKYLNKPWCLTCNAILERARIDFELKDRKGPADFTTCNCTLTFSVETRRRHQLYLFVQWVRNRDGVLTHY
jgi:hypothetical protein